MNKVLNTYLHLPLHVLLQPLRVFLQVPLLKPKNIPVLIFHHSFKIPNIIKHNQFIILISLSLSHTHEFNWICYFILNSLLTCLYALTNLFL